jgi:PEP-CTERM motif
MRLSKSALTIAALVFTAATPLKLHASAFTFTISTSNAPGADPATIFTASGTINGNPDPFVANAFDITSITGSGNGFIFENIIDPGIPNSGNPITDMGFTFNNVLYVTPPPHVDNLGFLVEISSPIGLSLAHVYFSGVTASNPGGYEVDVVDPREPGAVTPFAIESFTVVPTPITPGSVPEPSSIALLGAGLAGFAGLLRRRFTN